VTAFAVKCSDENALIFCCSSDRESRLYAIEGLPELWVIDGDSRRTWHYRAPGIDGYADIRDLAPNQPLIPACAPDLKVHLAALDTP